MPVAVMTTVIVKMQHTIHVLQAYYTRAHREVSLLVHRFLVMFPLLERMAPLLSKSPPRTHGWMMNVRDPGLSAEKQVKVCENVAEFPTFL